MLEEIYFDEIEPIIKFITKQKADYYLNMLSVVANPNAKNPQRLFNHYQSILNPQKRSGINELKRVLNNSSKIKVK